MTYIRIIDRDGGKSLGRYTGTFLPCIGHTVAIGSKRYKVADVVIVYNISVSQEESIVLYVDSLNKEATRIVNEMLNVKSKEEYIEYLKK